MNTRTTTEKPMRIKPPICDCKQGHTIIAPVIGHRCRKCGAEEKSWEVVRPDAMVTLQHENAILIDALLEVVAESNQEGIVTIKTYVKCYEALRQVEG